MKSGFRAGLLLLIVAVGALAAPSYALAERPNIDRVVVSRNEDGILKFRINFANPVIIDPDDAVQVAIDADSDSGTGVDGLDYSLDVAGPLGLGPPGSSLSLLTAVDGKPVVSHPPTLRFSRTIGAETYGFGSSSMTFSIPASAIGDPRRFDFYVFARVDGALDEAPSHVFSSAGTTPWTYPKHGEPRVGSAYPAETYVDGSDITLKERPGIVIALIAASVLVIGGVLAIGGWGVQRRRSRRNDSRLTGNDVTQA